MPIINGLKITIILIFCSLFLSNCGNMPKLPGADAKKYPPDPKERVKRNLEEGRGFRLDNTIDKMRKGGSGGTFDFASSNELWKASLDVLGFMPLTSANYSGGLIITDWYSDNQETNESIKITIRFLSNEIRSDAMEIKVFYKNCGINLNCKISENEGALKTELRREILKKAAIYKKQTKDKNFKPYNSSKTR